MLLWSQVLFEYVIGMSGTKTTKVFAAFNVNHNKGRAVVNIGKSYNQHR